MPAGRHIFCQCYERLINTLTHISKTFSAARVNQGMLITWFVRHDAVSPHFTLQELAKEGIPLPFGNKFWASNWPTGESPMPGLIAHLIPSVGIAFYERNLNVVSSLLDCLRPLS